jgi:hypothetical protein
MDSIDIDWLRGWAAQRNMSVSVDGLLTLSYRDPAPSKRVTVLTDPERTPGDLLLLANRLVWVYSEDDKRVLAEEDRQYLFWIRENGIWSDMEEALASDAFGSLFRAHGLASDSEGCLVPQTESRVAVLLALNAIIFGWDAYLIPLSGRFLCHMSHDGYVDLRTSQESLFQDLLERFRSWGAEERATPEEASQ